MKAYFICVFRIVVFFCIFVNEGNAQNVGINATGVAADTSAGLDISFTNKGLLIPRVTLTAVGDAVTIPRPATSLLVYNLGTGGLSPAGYYYNSGTKAVPVWLNLADSKWIITGNSGTIDGTNFIGSTDSVAFGFKVNNFKAGQIDPAGAVFFGYKAGLVNNDATNTGVGYKALYSVTDGAGNGGANTAVGYRSLYSNLSKNNTAVGYQSLYFNTTGSYNTGIGESALYKNNVGSYNTATGEIALTNNTVGSYNTATGVQSLTSDTSGSGNTATGYLSLYSTKNGNYNTADGHESQMNNTTGSENTSVGYRALKTNTTGSYNVAIGSNADVTLTNLSKAASIGYNAKVAASNSLVLGGTGADAVKVGIGLTTPLSTLSVSGSIAGKYREGNTITMDATDFFVNLTAAGDATLPVANGITAGTMVIIRNSTASAINLNRSGTDTMCNLGIACGSTSISIPAYSVVHYTSDGVSVWNGW